ncbi:SDR family NAD(P)-dependent oxidoreductase [Nocardia sp. 004]|uniref:SDR family NAD(P)-dependent oxidoreductase n=1 Tax=Nocardia sp. 004 TaxID=3385978 RepID=UPI0039A04C69
MNSLAIDPVGVHPPVAIIGIGCLLSGAANVAEFRQLLFDGRGGHLDTGEAFDNDWFTHSEREALDTDPRQPLHLMVAVAALDDAGIGYCAGGSDAAVVFGVSGYDHGNAVRGSALGAIANQVSAALELRGPSLVLDSSCSSSLTAIDLAVRLLADHTVPFAIVGGIDLVFPTHTSEHSAENGFLSTAGRTYAGGDRPFDIATDGAARDTACAVVVLQRTADAQRAGNRIYAEIIVTTPGVEKHSNGSDTPNTPAQQETMRTTPAHAGLPPHRVGYIEGHGTGTTPGDVMAVSGTATAPDTVMAHPIRSGAGNADSGYPSAAGGIAGLIETALSIQHGILAATNGIRGERPAPSPAEHGLREPDLPVDRHRIPTPEHTARVHSFGSGGTNVRTVLRGVTPARYTRGEQFPVLLALSAPDAEELRERALRWADELAATRPPLREFAAAMARSFPEPTRAAVVARDHDDAVRRLRALGHGAADAALGPASIRHRGGLLLLFSGAGGHHSTMGRALAARYPVFAAALAEVTDAITAAGGPRIWTPRHGFASARETSTTESVQPALFAFHVALAQLLAEWGIRPDAVAGHGPGEIAAAVVSGALSLRDAARVIVLRSAVQARSDNPDALAALAADHADVATLVEPMRKEVRIIAVNGPRSVVVSGTPRYIEILLRRAARRNISAHRLAVDFAAHSPLTATALPQFVAALDELTPLPPHVPVYSTTRRSARITTATMDRTYWAENATATVELAAALDHAAEDGISTVLELAPRPMSLSAIQEHQEFRESTYPVTLPEDEVRGFLTCLARLHLEGRAVDWSALGPCTAALPRQQRPRKFPLPVLVPAERFPFTSRNDTEFTCATAESTDHMTRSDSTVPTVFWLRRLLRLARDTTGATALADFAVHEKIEQDSLPEVRYHGPGAERSMRAEVTGTGTLASARPTGDPTPADIVAWIRMVDANRAARPHMHIIPTGTFYAELRRRRLEYGPRSRALRSIAAGAGRALGLLDTAELHYDTTLDSCLQLLFAAVFDELPGIPIPQPIGMDSAWLSHEPKHTVLEVHALVRERIDTGLIGDVVATDQHGVPCLALSGVRMHYVDAALASGTGTLRTPYEARDTYPMVFRREIWEPSDPESSGIYDAPEPHVRHAVVIGASELAAQLGRALGATIATELIPREPDNASSLVTTALTERSGTDTAVVVVWPAAALEGQELITALGRVLDLLQRISTTTALASVIFVLPQHDTVASVARAALGPAAIAGLVRSLQLETERVVRLVWTDTDPRNLPLLCRLVTAAGTTTPDELRLCAGEVATRHFTPAAARVLPGANIDTDGTYVVIGGLGTPGSVAVRWLLDAGARDVVVLTRAPRPVPALLDGMENRLIVMRCDATDRDDLANALNDIRACGSTIRGVVHAAAVLEDTAFDAVTAAHLSRMFAAKLTAASNMIELTATDPTDFVLLFSSATGALGGQRQAAYAAANAAMDALAQREPGRRILSIGWGPWDFGPSTMADGPKQLLGTTMLHQALRYAGPYLLAVDYSPTTDTSPSATRLAQLLAPPHAPGQAPGRGQNHHPAGTARCSISARSAP